MHFYCQCLNVTIDVLEINNNQQTPFLLTDLIPSIILTQKWFESNTLSQQAIHITWHSLFQSISIRDMKLNRCLACNQYTHITNIQSNKILINQDLLNDTTVKQSYEDRNYSKIAKIILPKKINSPSMTSLLNFQDEIFQHEYEIIQQLYRQSLEDADRETEEKIRTYEYEQKQILKMKTEALNNELSILSNFIRSTPRYISTNIETSPILQTSNSYLNENSMESGFGSDVFDTNGTDLNRQSSTFERTYSERTSNLDDDFIFDNTDLSNFAISLPKDIAFQPYATIPQQNNGDSNDIDRIGESFRELSQSLMCTDGTEVFGDLPSPRLNARPT